MAEHQKYPHSSPISRKEEQKQEAVTVPKVTNNYFSSPTSVLLAPHHSNTSITSSSNILPPPLLNVDDDFQLTPSSYHINLQTLVQLLPDTIRNNKSSADAPSTIQSQNSANNNNDDAHDPVGSLFRRLTFSKEDLEPYYFIDKDKSYTRNLIATDEETFTLLLLCWNPMKYSPIHDHPCDGCWMRVCQGCINEVRYVKEEKNGKDAAPFSCTMDTVFEKGQQTFIHDNIGYHKVGNPSDDTIALSMHLYSPPFNKCKIWMDQDASSSTIARMCNYSEYGHRKSYK